jgi:uncharacterized protein (DUF2342 family)
VNESAVGADARYRGGMSNGPFGFRPDNPDDPEGASGGASSGGGQGGSDVPGVPGMPGMPGMPGGFPFNLSGPEGQPMDIGAALQQLGQLLSWQGGPVNWDLARQAARQTVAAQPDPSVGAADAEAMTEAVRLADLWLDTATDFPAATSAVRAWSRAEWVEGTIDGWKLLVEPLAEQVVGAMGKAIPAEAAAMAGPLVGVMRQVGMSLWGAQVGQGLGQLATEVIGVTDIGIPLTDAGQVALVPRNISEFGTGLNLDSKDVRLYLAMRETARHRLHAHAPWLRGHIIALVEAFARGITIDTSRLEEAVRDLDPSQPEALSRRSSRDCSSPSAPRHSKQPWTVWRSHLPPSRAGWTTSSPRPPRTGCRPPMRCARPCAEPAPPEDPPKTPSRPCRAGAAASSGP